MEKGLLRQASKMRAVESPSSVSCESPLTAYGELAPARISLVVGVGLRACAVRDVFGVEVVADPANQVAEAGLA